MTVRKIELVRAAWGAALLIAPRWVLHHVHHVDVDGASVAVARVLGARQLGQASLSGLGPSSEVLALGVWVDAVHSASMIALAGIDRSRARGALTDAAVAGTWALLGYHDLQTARTGDPAAGGARDTLARWILARLPGGGVLRARAREAAC